MKTLLLICGIFTLAGCATVTSTDINPALNQIANDGMALVAAASGDCSLAITAPPVGPACAPVAVNTSTVDQTKKAVEGCITAAATTPLATQAAVLKAAKCGAPPAPAPAPVTGAKP
jgi:hypothetical protein